MTLILHSLTALGKKLSKMWAFMSEWSNGATHCSFVAAFRITQDPCVRLFLLDLYKRMKSWVLSCFSPEKSGRFLHLINIA